MSIYFLFAYFHFSSPSWMCAKSWQTDAIISKLQSKSFDNKIIPHNLNQTKNYTNRAKTTETDMDGERLHQASSLLKETTSLSMCFKTHFQAISKHFYSVGPFCRVSLKQLLLWRLGRCLRWISPEVWLGPATACSPWVVWMFGSSCSFSPTLDCRGSLVDFARQLDPSAPVDRTTESK